MNLRSEFLGIFAGISVVCFLSAVPTLDANLRLLRHCLDALERTMVFLASQSEDLNLDAAVLLCVARDQLRMMVSDNKMYLKENRNLKILAQLVRLEKIAQSAAEESAINAEKNGPEYFEDLGKLTEPNLWNISYPVGSLPTSASPKAGDSPALLIPFKEAVSDQCIKEIIGPKNSSEMPCNVPDTCWTFMSNPGDLNYAVTHSILYFLLAEQAGCSQNLALHSAENNISTTMENLCVRILREAEGIEATGFRSSQQDLFMEQIFVCGILGYRDFVRSNWIKSIVSWQDLSGCFTRVEFEKRGRRSRHHGSGPALIKTTYGGGLIRKKRQDVPLAGSCSAHRTAVALGALLTSSKLLLQEMTAGNASRSNLLQ